MGTTVSLVASAATRQPLVDILEASGLQVVSAVGTVGEGLTAIDADVTITDFALPDGNGIQLCEALTARQPNAKVIIHVPHLSEEIKMAGLTAGASAVIEMRIRGSGRVCRSNGVTGPR